MRALLLAGAAACAPPADALGPFGRALPEVHDPTAWLEDNWRSAVEACPPPEPFVDIFDSDSRASSFFDEVCQQHLLDVVGTDLASFEECDDNGWYHMIGGLYNLLGRDLGRVDDLDDVAKVDAQYIRPPFVETVRQVAAVQGHADVAPALFDLVTSTILTTSCHEFRDADEDGYYLLAGFDIAERHLMLGTRFGGVTISTTGTLTHEAMHGWANARHVTCPEGPYADWGLPDVAGHASCDEDWTGPRGHAVGYARLAYWGVLPGDAAEDMYRHDASQFILDESRLILEE